MAFTVGTAFSLFCKSLRFSDSDLSTIRTRYHNIARRINNDYWNITSDTKYSLYVGSYGRDTEIHTSDIDMLIQLPPETYKKFNSYRFNGQSALLQEVKQVIKQTYPTSTLKADGQIISIPFSDGINFEILPAFLNTDDSYTFANSNNGGSWQTTDPKAEINAINNRNNACNSNLKMLCKMVRVWKEINDVNISGILIDILAYNFICSWEYYDKSFYYYDWLTRDFMKYLSEIPTSQHRWQAMGSGRYITYNGKFQFKAKQAYETALEAISNESISPYIANMKWREIYGNRFPIL